MSFPERIVPDETSPGIVALHLKRYQFALPYCGDAEVLDAGCGAGYGTSYLAARAVRVVGIDRDENAIAYARDRYGRENVAFRVADLHELDFPADSFDVVCAFETLEHLTDPDAFLAGVARVLRTRGVFLASTPRAAETTREAANPFHAVEFSEADFEALLRRIFEDVELYGQRRLQTRRHRLLQRVDVLGLRRRVPFLKRAARLLGTPPTEQIRLEDVEISRDVGHATELVAVCRRPRKP